MPKGDREKLKADPEDGTTPIANLLLEALAIAKLTGKEKGVCLYLCRVTYGWMKNGQRLKEAELTLKDWAGILQIDTAKASHILSGLVKNQIIKREFLGAGKGYIYTLNTRVVEWGNSCINLQLLSNLGRQPLPKKTRHVLSKTTTPSATKPAMLKENIKESIKESKENIKRKYGEFQNVLLTDEEYQKLKDRLGNKTDEFIERLSAYMKSTGKRYASHYATILNWYRRDNEKAKGRGLPGPKDYEPTADYPDI